MSSAQDGQGTTISFGTSGFSAGLIAVNGPNSTRAAIDATLMSTTGAKVYIPAELYDAGELKITVEHDGSDTYPINGAAETITIAWSGGANTDIFSGFFIGVDKTAEIGDRMRAVCSIKLTGLIT